MDKATRLSEEIADLLKKQLQSEEKNRKISNLNKPNLKVNWFENVTTERALQEKQSKLKSIVKKQQKILSEEKIKKEIEEISKFSSGKIKWVINKRKQLYPEWDGYYDNKHIFIIKQGVLGFQLILVEASLRDKQFKKIQESAEFFLENFTFKRKQNDNYTAKN